MTTNSNGSAPGQGIKYTFVISVKSLSKILEEGADGLVHKPPKDAPKAVKANLYEGEFWTRTAYGIDELAAQVLKEGNDPKKLLFLGHHLTLDHGKITWSGSGLASATCLARNEENFGWRDGEPTAVLLDSDVHADSAEQADKMLCAAVPELAVANPRRFWKPSASSCVLNAQGQWVHRAFKWHCILAITDSAMAKRFVEHVFMATFEAGHGFVELGEGDKVCLLYDRTLIDPTVAQGSREVFEYGGNLKTPGWTQPHADYARVFGDPAVQMLDVARAFQQLWDIAVWKEKSQLRKRLRDEKEPLRIARNIELGRPDVARLKASGVSEADAWKAVAAYQTDSMTVFLHHLFEIQLKNRKIVAGDPYVDTTLQSPPGQGIPCKDPLEPNYANSAWPAKLYYGSGQHSGEAYICSWAHGIKRTFRLSKSPEVAFADAPAPRLPAGMVPYVAGHQPITGVRPPPPSQGVQMPQHPSAFASNVVQLRAGSAEPMPAPDPKTIQMQFQPNGAYGLPQAVAAASWGLEQTGYAPAQNAPRVIDMTPLVLRSEREMPRRPFLYGLHYIRGETSGTYAPGGLGKTALATVEQLAMLTGFPLLGIAPRRPLRVVYFGEEGIDEIDRRMLAACKQYGVDWATMVGDRFVRHSLRSVPLKLVTANGSHGFQVNSRDVAALTAAIQLHRADVVFFDTMKKIHQASENDNGDMDALIEQLNMIAQGCACSIMLLGHTKKPSIHSERATSDARGASSQIDALRCARLIVRMTKEEAAKLDINPDKAWQYIRIGDTKENMAPPPDRAAWLRLVSMALDNGDPFAENDHGKPDNLQVVVQYFGSKIVEGFTEAQIGAVIEYVNKGKWRSDSQTQNWIGYPISDALDVDIGDYEDRKKYEKERNNIKKQIKQLILDGVLETYAETDKFRVLKKFVRVTLSDEVKATLLDF